jgi:dihydrodipicolinate synthase/N-acetylneuraminate lyase
MTVFNIGEQIMKPLFHGIIAYPVTPFAEHDGSVDLA